ncbi:MAG: hypothetical protein M3156_05605 [Thermoproteota archaeon]|jgi:hypothetical protein|nr:hypothetical protein [Thermoproteota archaeon]
MNKKYQTEYVNFSGIGLLAVIVVSSLFAIGPFLQKEKALAQQETPMTNATELMSNQTGGLSLLSSVLNISRTAGEEATSTAAEYVLNATPTNTTVGMTNVTVLNNSQTNQ